MTAQTLLSPKHQGIQNVPWWLVRPPQLGSGPICLPLQGFQQDAELTHYAEPGHVR